MGGFETHRARLMGLVNFGYHFGMEYSRSSMQPNSSQPSHQVVVVGGGLAGCAAAFNLSQALGPGAVTLVEARAETGGRARSFTDPASGELIDNCQHLMMGCCINLRRFTDAMGLKDAWTHQNFLTFVTRDGRRSRFSAANLPAPLHLAGAFARLHTLPFRSKISLARAVLALASSGESGGDEPVLGWLARHSQGDRELKAFWEPVLVSALNDRMERLGIRPARKVFLEAFLGGKSAFDVWLPARPLGLIFGLETRRALEKAGVALQTDSPVRTIQSLKGSGWVVNTRDGKAIKTTHLVLATPHKTSWELLESAGVCPEKVAGGSIESKWSTQLGHSSITAIHLWFSRRFLPVEHAALVGGMGHWVFRKSWATQDDPYCQVLISASDNLLEESSEKLIEQAATELLRFFPEPDSNQPPPNLVRGKVVREKSATFQQSLGMDSWRPSNSLQVPGVSLAGDFTRTGWPATMEGAVRSGFLASHHCLTSLGVEPKNLLAIQEPKLCWFQQMLAKAGA